MYLFSSPEVDITTSLHFHHFPEPVKLGRGLWKGGMAGRGAIEEMMLFRPVNGPDPPHEAEVLRRGGA